MTGEELLAAIKTRITMPANQQLFSDADILKIADATMKSTVIPLLRSLRWEFFVFPYQFTLTANQDKYDIPYRSIGNTVRDLKLVPTGQTNPVRNLVYIQPEDSHLYYLQNDPAGFYFENDQIVIAPSPATSTFDLIMPYYVAPGKFIQTTQASKVTSIVGGVVNVDNVPSEVSSASQLDFIKGRPGYRFLNLDITPISSGSNSITFNVADVPTDLVAGDYIAPAGYSPVVQLPPDAEPYLVSMSGMYCLESVDDSEGASKIMATANVEREALSKVLSPRVEGENRKIINRRGILRGRPLNIIRGSGI